VSRSTPRKASDPREPLIRDVLPLVTRRVTELLRKIGEPERADGLLDQRFYGRCGCGEDCEFFLTAPSGSSGGHMLWLEDGEDVIGQVSLDPSGKFITELEVPGMPA
jgi:hypothetical protein